jgi:hypothetical protein
VRSLKGNIRYEVFPGLGGANAIYQMPIIRSARPKSVRLRYVRGYTDMIGAPTKEVVIA